MRRGLAPALAALACLTVPAAAQAAPGDVAVADEGSWFGTTGSVLRVSPSGAATPLASGAPFENPWAVAVAPDAALFVADEGAQSVFRVNPAGTVRTIVHGEGLDDPVGIALGPAGKAYVSDRNSDAVLRLDLASGALAKVADVHDAAGLAFDKSGKLLVTDGRVLRRVDPATGAVTIAAEGAPLEQPRDVAVAQDGTLYVLGDRQVVRIAPGPGGAKTVLASGAPFVEPSAIDIAPDGNLVVADRYAAGGGVIWVDRRTGVQSILASGSAFRRPTGIASVGGAGVDASGGGNGDPDGPAAPPPPPPPGGGSGGTGGGGGGAPGGGTPGGTGAPGGGTRVTLPNGTVVILPPGITPATSGIRGIDFAAPSFLRKPHLTVTRFRAARRGRAFVSLAVGTFINYVLSEAARITISVQKARPLSRICRRRLAQQSRHRTGTCRRYVSLQGRFATASAAGAGSVRFRGRLKGRRLKPGRYRFVIRATDGAGNVSATRRPAFRIVR